MKASCAAIFALFLGAAPQASVAGQAESNPLGKVIDLIDELAAKVTADGENEAKAYAEYIEWCDDASTNSKFAVEDATKQQAKLEAKIGELTSDISVADSKIGELAGAISTGGKELSDAQLIREKETADFAAGEKELVDAVDTLGRAVGVLEKEMAKNPAALAQVDTTKADKMLEALSVVLDAASFASTDKHKLQSLLQAQQESSDDDAEPGAPAAATYKSHTGGIFDVLEDLKEKAEGQLAELRKAESNTKHNYELLRTSLEAQKDADTKDMNAQQAAKAGAEEDKAGAEGDLEITVKTLKSSSDELATARSTCMTVAADHEATEAARTEELKTIAEAKKILVETSSGAVSQTYSLLQLSSGFRLQNRMDLANSEVVTVVRQLAKKHHSAALAQLASRIAAVAKYGSANGDDVFSKIKGLISDMISKLEKEAGEEATEKSYCDEEMAKTAAKKSELDDDIAKLTSKIDQDSSKSAQLKEEVRVLESELASITKEQAEMDKIRMETHEDYTVSKKDLELGLTGVRKALHLLREYYGGGASLIQDDAFMQQPAAPEHHSKSSGAGQSIVGILEVCESDFANNLAKEEQEEADAESNYQKMTQENKITVATKEQDVKYKTQESKSLDSTVAELSSDRETTNSELSAVLEYDGKIKERCIAKPETYEERSARRAAEIEGLKKALTVLNDETAFLQKKNRRHSMRGSVIAAQ
eukprot:CAMPEP_0177237140 /NCGR_PEP_ID=MMETSP0367-20130122/45828_1 /TAXON_ID=447022 ORGANISM="Scrippsiella hangoei-like, Strain SHHI-4" /NCGR_SAMPLE_ID=MMETSP0367 /ASSEMBLY_ACC=CAM_ASM_000362 /LENGTH=707 /DNA_ID=CAMNT_0018688095 /DNA_START=64 /DNA_END=2187 /DNA_ORIENTATION=+